MKGYRTEIFVGLFGLMVMGIIVYMSREVSDTPFEAGEGNTYTVRFDSVAGLIERTPIEIAGIQVGFIDEIKLEENRAKLRLEIDPKIKLYEDAVAYVTSRGILGDKLLSINPGTTGKRQLKSGDEFGSSGGGSDIDQLFMTLEKTASNVNELAAALKEFVTEEQNAGTLNRIVANVEEMTAGMNDFVRSNTDALQAVIRNMKSISDSLNEFVEGNVNTDLSATTKSLRSTMGNLETIMADLEAGHGTVGKLLRDESTINSLNNAVEGIEEITGNLSRIQTDIRYRGEYLFESEDLQNLVALTIRPRPDKFFRFEIVDAVEGDSTLTTTSVRQPNGVVLSETETIQTSDKILFSLELAKRFYDTTFRFGLIRNEGGIGLDQAFLDDMLVLSMEAFNFSRIDNNFHMRVYATLQLWRYVLLTVGADDLVDSGNSVDPFIGAGISFRDDDIKTLFGAFSLSNFN